MICNNYYVYEDKSMKVLEHIAKAGKPVLFHSGILWGGEVSAQYNKPINWECCLKINGLKFSLAHCSWPWYDECLAVYGKYYNVDWSVKWQNIDNRLYDKLSVDEETRSLIYVENMKRFLGITRSEITHACPLAEGTTVEAK